MISLKRYLDATATDSSHGELLTALVDAYQSALTAAGAGASQACPSVDPGLRRRLTALGLRLQNATESQDVQCTDALVTQELQQWGDLAAADLQQKTKDVKELLIVLATTASTIASSNHKHASRFDAFRARLEKIADLEDLTQLRSSLVRSAAELRQCVEEMSQHARASVTQLQAELVTYQGRLEAAEELAARDPLTGLLNRAGIEAHIATRIALAKPFAVALIDLNGFKAVNDRLGHFAGDDLLKQFTGELRANARATDHLGRWGGDEFIVVLDCTQAEAQTHLGRIEQWIVGDYVIEAGGRREKVRLEASIGVSEWRRGQTVRGVIDQADAAMYGQKHARR